MPSFRPETEAARKAALAIAADKARDVYNTRQLTGNAVTIYGERSVLTIGKGTRDIVVIPQRKAYPMLGVGLILVGGWMLNVPGAVYLVPVAVFAGLIAVGGVRINRVVMTGMAISAILMLDGIHDQRALAFGLMFFLCSLTAGIAPKAIERGFEALPVIGVATSAFVWGQQFVDGGRAVGLLNLNSNATAGFLLVAAVWTLLSGQRRAEWVAMVLLLGIAPTGSRWGIVCVIIVLGAMVAAKHISTRSALIAVVPLLVVTVSMFLSGHGAMARLANHVTAEEIVARAVTGDEYTPLSDQTITVNLSTLAFGTGYQGGGSHNLLIRATDESGYVGATLLLLALGWGFAAATKRSRWMLVTLLALGMMDFYMWGPFQLAPLLWMAMGMRKETP